MTRSILFAGLILAFLSTARWQSGFAAEADSGGGQHVRKPVNQPPRTRTVRGARITADFQLTGDLSNSVWQKATPVQIEVQSQTTTPRPELSTTARILWSDQYLYLGYEAPFTRLTVFEPARLNEKRLGLWDRDVVEAFIGPDPAHANHYSEYEVAPTGEKLDLLLRLPEKDFQWNSGFEAAVKVDEQKHIWRTEMRIPLRALSPTPPAVGTRWRINLYRCDRANRASMAWSPTLTQTFHTPDRFGWLEFGN